MSQSEVERFVADLKSDAGMREALRGSVAGVASVVAFAQARGYDVDAGEARQYIQSQTGRDLSDAELDQVAGGKGHHSTSTQTVQTVYSVTTEATSVETTTSAVAEAVVVIVLT